MCKQEVDSFLLLNLLLLSPTETQDPATPSLRNKQATTIKKPIECQSNQTLQEKTVPDLVSRNILQDFASFQVSCPRVTHGFKRARPATDQIR